MTITGMPACVARCTGGAIASASGSDTTSPSGRLDTTLSMICAMRAMSNVSGEMYSTLTPSVLAASSTPRLTTDQYGSDACPCVTTTSRVPSSAATRCDGARVAPTTRAAASPASRRRVTPIMCPPFFARVLAPLCRTLTVLLMNVSDGESSALERPVLAQPVALSPRPDPLERSTRRQHVGVRPAAADQLQPHRPPALSQARRHRGGWVAGKVDEVGHAP